MKLICYCFLSIVALLVASTAAHAQSPLTWGWGKTIGGAGSESPAAIAADSRNGVYVFGKFSGSINTGSQTLTSAGGSDLYLVKYDTTGNLLWAARFGSTGNEEAASLKTDRSGNLVFTGNFEGSVSFGSTVLTSTGASDICIVKLHPDGTVVWAKQFTGSMADKGGALVCDGQRNIFTTGTYLSNDLNIGGSIFTAPKTSNVFYCKLDSNGNKIWAKTTSSNTSFRLYNFDVLPGSILLMHGSMVDGAADYVNFSPPFPPPPLPPAPGGMLSTNRCVFTVKTDTAGNFISQSISSDGSGRVNGGGTALGPGSRVIKAGSRNGFGGTVGALLAAYDTSNIERRSKSVCGCAPKQTALYDIAAGKNGHLFSVGFSAGEVIWDGIQQYSSGAVFTLWETDTALTTRNLLNNIDQTIGNQYFNSIQHLTKIAADTITGFMYTAGYFSFSNSTTTFTVGSNVMPYYGSDDIFIGQVKYVQTALRVNAGNDTTICTGLAATIGRPGGATGGTPPYNYSWSPATGIANPAAASTLASPAVSTVYILTVTDAANNVVSDTVSVNVIPSPTVTPSISVTDSTLCQGDTATFSANAAGAYSYNWYKNTAFITNTSASAYQTTTAGSYTVRFRDNNTGCASPQSRSIIIQVSPLSPAPTITPGGRLSFCLGDSVVLTSSFDSNYLWSNGATTRSITVRSSGSFTVTTSSGIGCGSLSASPVMVAADSRPVLGADSLIYHACYGDNTNLLLLYNTTGFTAVWNTPAPAAAPPGNYRLIASSNPGCADTALATIRLEVARWTGGVSDNWHTPDNWSTNKVPTALTHVIIDNTSDGSTGGESPVISTANAVVASLQLRNGATLTTSNGMTITVVGNCAVLPPN